MKACEQFKVIYQLAVSKQQSTQTKIDVLTHYVDQFKEQITTIKQDAKKELKVTIKLAMEAVENWKAVLDLNSGVEDLKGKLSGKISRINEVLLSLKSDKKNKDEEWKVDQEIIPGLKEKFGIVSP